MTMLRALRGPWALGGVLFAAFFILGDVLRGILANDPPPLARRARRGGRALLHRKPDGSRGGGTVPGLFGHIAVRVRRPRRRIRAKDDERGGALTGLTSGGVLSAMTVSCSTATVSRKRTTPPARCSASRGFRRSSRTAAEAGASSTSASQG
jgi:hypothetical protein